MSIGRVIDLSSNNHPGTKPITWAKVKAAGVTAAIIKATQGTTYLNPWYGPDTSGARAVGIDTLAYHYADWGTVNAEAAWFISKAGNLARMLDAENTINVEWSNTFMARCAPTPTQRLYYAGTPALSQIRSQIQARLMVADYPAHGAPTVGYPGYGVLWQWTDQAKIPGIVGTVDESKWYGTETQYDILFDVPAPKPKNKGDEMIAATSTGNGYWQVRTTGAVFAWGDATYHGGANTGDLAAGDVIVGIAGHGTDGYWLSATSGAVFAFGSAKYYGGYNEQG